MPKKNIENALTPCEQVSALLKIITKGLYEKEQILALALLSMVSGESFFLLGPPGTAKSEVSRRLKLILKDATAFEYLMSRFSTPDEIFGPVSIQKLKNEDTYERKVDGFLPSAEIVFLDEIWKAGPSIQNALLTVINEHIYLNGNTTLQVPMQCLIAASNELPAEGEGLEALWDRFLVRVVSNCIQNETTFYKMLQMQEMPSIEIPESLLLTREQLSSWRSDIYRISVPQSILSAITAIRQGLQQAAGEEGANAADYYISDRRWRKTINLLRASAFLNGRTAINYSDLLLLIHILWNKAECIVLILQIVTDSLVADIRKSLLCIDKAYQDGYALLVKAQMDNPQKDIDEARLVVFHYMYYALDNYPTGTCYLSKMSYQLLQFDSDSKCISYFDQKLNATIIRLFDQNMRVLNFRNQQNVRMLQVRRGWRCILVDSVPYQLVQNEESADEALPTDTADDNGSMMQDLASQIATLQATLEERIDEIKSGNNLFVAKEDLQLFGQNTKNLLREIKTLQIKILNTKA